MKKLLFIFILFSGNLSAQKIELPDSIKSLLLSDTTVINTGYIWKTDAKENQEGSYFTSYYNPHYLKERRNYPTIHRVGGWRYYRKDGSIRRTEYIPYKSTNVITSTSFRKDGSKKYVQTLRKSETLILGAKSDKGPLKQKINTVNFYENGNLKSNTTLFGLRFINDIITYYENGQMKMKYSKNLEHKRNGKYSRWNEDGSVRLDGQYENGKKIGTWKVFDKDGNLKKEKNY